MSTSKKGSSELSVIEATLTTAQRVRVQTNTSLAISITQCFYSILTDGIELQSLSGVITLTSIIRLIDLVGSGLAFRVNKEYDYSLILTKTL